MGLLRGLLSEARRATVEMEDKLEKSCFGKLAGTLKVLAVNSWSPKLQVDGYGTT